MNGPQLCQRPHDTARKGQIGKKNRGEKEMGKSLTSTVLKELKNAALRKMLRNWVSISSLQEHGFTCETIALHLTRTQLLPRSLSIGGFDWEFASTEHLSVHLSVSQFLAFIFPPGLCLLLSIFCFKRFCFLFYSARSTRSQFIQLFLNSGRSFFCSFTHLVVGFIWFIMWSKNSQRFYKFAVLVYPCMCHLNLNIF